MISHKDTMALPGNYRQRPNLETKMRGNDRILTLKKIDGEARGPTGLIDNRIFEGKNRLHAVYDEQEQLWYLKYEQGKVPQALDMKYTSFSALVKHAKPYFANRNIELIDAESATS
jgi:hypothetical protein